MGFFIAWFGVNTTFLIILGYTTTAAILVAQISKKPVVNISKTTAALESVREGLRFVFNNKINNK